MTGLLKNGTQLLTSLPHLNARTASKHVLLWTTDVDSLNGLFTSGPLLSEATYIHLGDDISPSRFVEARESLLALRDSLKDYYMEACIPY